MRRKKKASFGELVRIMAKLRAPGGCAWDRAQTHQSLLKYLKEETKEVCEAVRKNDMGNLKEELGDILLHVLFHANIARERGDFDVTEVMGILKRKLIVRHPHVFGKDRHKKLTPKEIKARWGIIKERERRKELRKQS